MFYKEIFDYPSGRQLVLEQLDAICHEDPEAICKDPHTGQDRPARTILAHLGWSSETKRLFVARDTPYEGFTAWVNTPVSFTHVCPLGVCFEDLPVVQPAYLDEWLLVDKIARTTPTRHTRSSKHPHRRRTKQPIAPEVSH